MAEEFVIITAGGLGSRMRSSTPKQFMELAGKPVIMHSMQCFAMYSGSITMILVLPEVFIGEWKELCKKYNFQIKHSLCSGGKTRFHSVQNGLKLVNDKGLVAIHDAVRPLISSALIKECFNAASKKGNAVPALPLRDSVREISGDENRPVDRLKFRLIQTPQVFEVMLIKKAYEQAYRPSFTDDATVAEAIGVHINLLKGIEENIKITTPEDLKIAEVLYRKNP
ncbi:MAG: 2-C-methyl-D-erythritol 4-phosphate cytidylyltransferase [Bacteroidetes bacterium]|nr:2-C-methyl-D-erythritol 4-phosphate cytidylyltransferase [Bacteroidota bacterium]